MLGGRGYGQGMGNVSKCSLGLCLFNLRKGIVGFWGLQLDRGYLTQALIFVWDGALWRWFIAVAGFEVLVYFRGS